MVPDIVAVGSGFTVTIAEPVWAWLHVVVEASVTLTRLYVKAPAVPVGAVTVAVVLVPEPATVVFAPPLIL